MLRTILFVVVVGFAVSASARPVVEHIDAGIPQSVSTEKLLDNSVFFNDNVIAITGFHSDGSNLNFSFNYKTCNTFLKNTAFTTSYLLVNPTTVFVKLQLNPEYKVSTIQQASCSSKNTDIRTQSRTAGFFFIREIKNQFKDIDLKNLKVIVANDYQSSDVALDLTSANAIDAFIAN